MCVYSQTVYACIGNLLRYTESVWVCFHSHMHLLCQTLNSSDVAIQKPQQSNNTTRPEVKGTITRLSFQFNPNDADLKSVKSYFFKSINAVIWITVSLTAHQDYCHRWGWEIKVGARPGY